MEMRLLRSKSNSTPVMALTLIAGVVILAVFLIGVLWALIVLIPFYAYLGVAIYFAWQATRKRDDYAATMRREVQRQRSFNDQEMRAWLAVLEVDQRNGAKRDRALRHFDNIRQPPQNRA